jgi:hypothetical protein
MLKSQRPQGQRSARSDPDIPEPDDLAQENVRDPALSVNSSVFASLTVGPSREKR